MKEAPQKVMVTSAAAHRSPKQYNDVTLVKTSIEMCTDAAAAALVT